MSLSPVYARQFSWSSPHFSVYVESFNASFLDAIGRIKQRPSELVLANTVTDDSGLYQCMARNEAGESWAAGRLMVNMSRFQPDPPQGLTCQVLSDSLVRLECKEPARSANNITAYTVHYFPAGG